MRPRVSIAELDEAEAEPACQPAHLVALSLNASLLMMVRVAAPHRTNQATDHLDVAPAHGSHPRLKRLPRRCCVREGATRPVAFAGSANRFDSLVGRSPSAAGGNSKKQDD